MQFRTALEEAAVLFATAGGIGRLPLAPGTWGSLLGLGLGVAAAGRTLGLGVLVVSFLLGVVVCGRAERHLGRHDPPSVILDEVWGMASVIILLPWVAASSRSLLAAFVLFRLFDILKPPPLKRLEKLPAGWGIMADDLGAALYTIAILMLILK